jgi:CDP-glucose 4,6-dehydratase
MNEWKNKRVLITGANGFIGGALTERLTSLGAEVFAFYHTVDLNKALFGSPVLNSRPLGFRVENTIIGDLRDPADCREAVSVSAPEVVFHLGAITQVTEARMRWSDVMMVNAVGTLNLLEALQNVDSKAAIICASSDKAYGHGDTKSAFTNDARLDRAVHPYDVSKACGDLAARAFAETHGMNLQVTRLANVYGPGDTNWKRLIPGVIRWILENRQIDIRSDGKHVRMYLYIDDAVDAYLRIAERMTEWGVITKPLGWNIAPDDARSVTDVLDMLEDIFKDRGVHIPEVKIWEKAKDEGTCLFLDDTVTRAYFGWKPEVHFRFGLENTIDWIMDYLALREAMK